MEKLAVYILAGGRSLRFGRDKATALLGGVPLLAHVASLVAPFARRVTVVAGRAGEYRNMGLPTIADPVPERGPLGGLLAALADVEAGWVLVVPCDIWRLRPAWVEALLAGRRPGAQAVVFRGARWEPLPGLYRTSARPLVAAALERGELALWRLLAAADTEAVPLPGDWPDPAQINSQDDLRRVESALAAPLPPPPAARLGVGLPEALELVLAHAPRLEPVELPLPHATGLVLAEPVIADRDLPPFVRAQVDGFAVRCADAGQRVCIAGEARAGLAWPGSLLDGWCVSVMTGAPCPPGTEAVVRREHTPVEGGAIAVPREIAPGANLAPAGSECRAGQVVAAPGDVVTPLVAACLATFGRDSARVVPRPRLGIVATGDELTPPGGTPGPAAIRSSNAPMLAALAAAAGLGDVTIVHAGDDLEALAGALAATAGCDLVVTTGGVSAGEFDLVPAALERAGAALLFRGVRQRPGGPMLAAVLGRRLVLGAPGTPLAALATFWRYALPAARAMAGVAAPDSHLVGRLQAPLARRRDVWSLVLARAVPRPTGGFELEPCGGRGGNDIFTPSLADALVELAPGEEVLPAGSEVGFQVPGWGP
ncbi:MAG TPA: NTP transferase domain-containing protein [Thermoanaerobaculaceae bacterium]|nr:NTP transferase domain-containing protein [Thermoanaerobaculaceae bacterium]HRS16678.1 NTP transferase domain-containing protein [Thermoanaerobaculaceae bacterium]